MTLVEINNLAFRRLYEHGLNNWKFKWDNAKRRFGCCDHYNKTITLSKILSLQRTYEQINDTILHEIAHALVGPNHGHDKVWKQKAIEIGCNGERCGEEIKIKGKYTLICDHCGRENPMFRKPKLSYSCGRCCTSRKYDPKFKMRLVVQDKVEYEY